MSYHNIINLSRPQMLFVGCSHSLCSSNAMHILNIVSSLLLEVAEEVGELNVHCFYGCRLKDPTGSEYEINSEGNSLWIKA